jgi:mRNA interferase MazF
MSEYIKNFDAWNIHKKSVDQTESKKLHFKERDVWWASVGINIGSEIDGKNELFERPVLVVKKLHGTKLFGIPLTTKTKVGSYFVSIRYGATDGVAVLVDSKVLSSKRLIRKIGKISIEDFKKVKEGLKEMLA